MSVIDQLKNKNRFIKKRFFCRKVIDARRGFGYNLICCFW
ncbi:hypothetical protein HMPREF3293_02345 [Christensenella minuta]|uniref:Uncharacterized protein n=1 Tax=Christensenella minuta TaxID=626937 RepID=A0A136Q386_9FIRM|nr:hypothetical protein HMPREF3293_02345 [Christensenella minuta]